MTEHRDERLGTMLAELETPEHDPAFWAELEARLDSEASPRLRRPRPGPAWWRARSRGWRLAASGIGAAAVLAVSLVAIRAATVTPEATAADVLKRAFDALEEVSSVSGTMVTDAVSDEGGGRFQERWRFAADGDGSLRFKLLTPPKQGRDDYALDGARAVSEELSIAPPPFREGSFALRTRGVPLGGPDPATIPDVLRRDLAASVLTYLERGDASVEETSFDGRDAWRLAAAANFGEEPARIEAVIDQDSGIPLELAIVVGGEVINRTRLVDLDFDAPLGARVFEIALPAGLAVERNDLGFRRTGLAGAERRAGYAPPLPRFVPEGFELDQVAVRVPKRTCVERCSASIFPPPTGVSARNPVAGPVLAVSYRAGLRQFVLTVRPAGRPELWEDPFLVDPGSVRAERLRLADGDLAGARAELVVDPLAEPHLWAVDERLAITVSGALSRDELVRLAESLVYAG